MSRSSRTAAALFAFALAARGAAGQLGSALVSAAGYGNFHAAGIEVEVAGDDDGDAAVALEWRRAGAPAFRPAQPLVRVAPDRFLGSLFGLAPGWEIEVRVTLTDPDGVTGPAAATAAFATRPDRLAEPSLRTLYVAPGGDDGNPGTDPAHPLATVQAAANRAQAGDLVSIAPGVYRESVTVARSGTAGQPIVFRGSGPGAVLDGADAAIAAGVAWTPVGGGTWSRVTGFPTGHVTSELGRLFRYGSLGELAALAAGPPGGFHFDGTTLSVRFADGSAPAGHTLHVARHEHGFLLDGRSHVRIEDLEIRHYGSGDYGKGVYLRYASDCAVRRCRIREVGAAGVWIKGGDRHLVERNEIGDTSIFDWPWEETKGSSAENVAILFTDEIGRGHVVRRNAVDGTFNGIAPCGASPPPGGYANETDVYENLLSRHTDDAFEPEGWCANVRLWGNRIERVHMAFAVAPAAPGPLWIVRNTAWGIGATRTSQLDGYTASALKINSGYATPVGPVLLLHNSFVTAAPATDALALLNPGESTWIRARNNVFAATADAIWKVNPVALDLDGDDLWTTGPRLAWWEGSPYATLAALQAGTGQELHGLSAPPDLVDPAAGDFTPRATSPLLDRALPLPGLNDLVPGEPPDVGAVERALLFADGFEEEGLGRWSGTP